MKSISVVIPVLNEFGSLPDLAMQLKQAVSEYDKAEVLFITAYNFCRSAYETVCVFSFLCGQSGRRKKDCAEKYQGLF